MMGRRYGFGRGYRWYRFYGRANEPVNEVQDIGIDSDKEYVYVGPCRCGRGPHAFYRARNGMLYHASEIRTGRYPYDASLEEKIRKLESENEKLRIRIADLESDAKRSRSD